MEKTITIDGKDVRLKSTGAIPMRYKAQFGKDFFSEVYRINGLSKLQNKKTQELTSDEINNIDFEIFYNLIWTLAKTADKNIPDPMTWLDEFDVFPIGEIVPEIQDIIIATMQSKKN